MIPTYLLLDGNYLSWRAFHTTGRLTAGVVYGFLRDINVLQERFNTEHVVFAFDFGRSVRCKAYQPYKANRRDKKFTPEDWQAYCEMKRQMRVLRSDYLPRLGYNNVFYRHGYEADDIMASVAIHLPEGSKGILVSADQDLYQLISPWVSCYNPTRKEILNLAGFREKYGIHPVQWVDVKGMAGCSSDNIKGIKGIGEKTATAFLGGRLNQNSVAYKNIVANNMIWERNRLLVTLPYPGTPVFKLQPDRVTQKKWRALTTELRMPSIADNVYTTIRS